MVTENDVVFRLAENIADICFEDLPPAAVASAKKGFLDTLGVMIAASGTYPQISRVVEFVEESGGSCESTVVASGNKVPCYLAAFANGAMAHCLDYDDVEYETTYHPSSAAIPAALAIAEKVRPVSGKDFITAVALAHDLGIRLARAIPAQRKPPWHRTVVLSIFAAAAAGAKLLRLEQDGVINALGLAFVQSSGTLELRWGVGSDIGGMYAAFPAKGGALSALLARKGVSGIRSPFEGRAGLFKTYFGGVYERERLVERLGTDLAGAYVAFKPWPAGAATFNYIESSLNLLRNHRIRPEDIDRITVHVGDWTNTLCQPLPGRQRPASVIDAKFSIPFCVATALSKGNVRIDDFSTEAIRNERVLSLAQKVTPQLQSRMNITHGLPPGAVQIEIGSRNLYEEVSKPLGHPANPLSWEVLSSKFRDCLAHAHTPLPSKNADRIINFIYDLEQVRDVAEISQWLA